MLGGEDAAVRGFRKTAGAIRVVFADDRLGGDAFDS
jgi:hypothetical protein